MRGKAGIENTRDIDMDNQKLIKKLNSKSKEERLKALKELKAVTAERGEVEGYTNNHVHSKFSFSPYSPSRIIYEAYKSGLATVGLMDHDSIAGAKEFIEAGELFGITTTVGFEIRSDWADTPFKDRRLNSPDQLGCGYICVHGVPHQKIDETENFLRKVRKARNVRNKRMVSRINELVSGISLDFENDVLPVSYADDGGCVTERHILFALAQKIVEAVGKGERLTDYIENKLDIPLMETQKKLLLDDEYTYYEYDLLNILKGSFVSKIYIPAEPPEIPPIKTLLEFCHSIGAIVGYAYLGDVGASPTGDKKAQKFEDDFLDELIEYLDELGFDAVAFMPSRNTKQQLKRIMLLCDKYDFFQISGEDINQPRQSFICEQLMDEDYRHLMISTWALVGHERKASENIELGMFSGENTKRKLIEKLPEFAEFGRKFER